MTAKKIHMGMPVLETRGASHSAKELVPNVEEESGKRNHC